MRKRWLLACAALIIAVLASCFWVMPSQAKTYYVSEGVLGAEIPSESKAKLDYAAIYYSPVGGRAYTPQCLGDCHMVVQIRSGSMADYSAKDTDSFRADYVDASAKSAGGCFAGNSVDIYLNHSWTEDVWVPKVVCAKEMNKTTGKGDDVCTDNGAYGKVERSAMSWQRLTEKNKPSAPGTYFIDVRGTRTSLAGGCRAVDAVPSIYGVSLPQFAWWNASWTSRMNFSLTAGTVSMVNNTLPVNVTWVTGMSATFADLRFTDMNGTELSYWVEDNVSSSFADVWLRVPDIGASTTVNVSMYYDNPAAASASSGGNTWQFFDDFSTGSVGSAPAGWTTTIPSAPTDAIIVVSNVSKYGKSAMIQDGNTASEPQLYTTLPSLEKWRSLSYARIESVTGSGLGFVYYHEDGATASLTDGFYFDTPRLFGSYSGAWTYWYSGWAEGMWHRIEFVGDSATDKYNVSLNGTAVIGRNYRYASNKIDTILFQSTDGVTGNEYIGLYAWGNYSGGDPIVQWGPAETVPIPTFPMLWFNATNTSAGYAWDVNVTWVGPGEQYNYSSIEANFSGSMFNYTNFSAAVLNANSTRIGYHETLAPAKAYGWRSHANSSDNSWNSTPLFTFINYGVSGLVMTASPGWGVTEGASATITCAAAAGVNKTLKLNGVIVPNPYTAVLSVGSYSFDCTVTDALWLPASASGTLTVGITGTGCTNSSTFAYSTTIVPAAKMTWVDLTTQYFNHTLRPDMGDIRSSDANLTVFYNGTNAYVLAVNNTPASMTIYFGNYYADLGLLNDTVPNATPVSPTVAQSSPYIYTFTEMNEMTAVAGKPPGTTDIYYTLFCPGGSNYVSINDSAATTQTIAAYSPLNRAELDIRYSAADFYYRDLLITAPVETRTFYWGDAATVTIVRTTFTLYDNSGLFGSPSLKVQKQIGNSLQSMTEGVFDSESKFVAYLIEGQEYQLTVTDGSNSRVIGLLYSDSSNPEKSIIIGTSGQPSAGNYTYSVAQNNITKAVTFTWIDSLGNTLNTSMWVYNATNESQLLFFGSSAAQNVQIVYTPPDVNASLKVVTKITNTILGTDCPGGTTYFWGAANLITRLTWSTARGMITDPNGAVVAFITGTFLIILAMSFSGPAVKLGAIVVAIFAAFFSYMQLWPVSSVLCVIIILLAILNLFGSKRHENL